MATAETLKEQTSHNETVLDVMKTEAQHKQTDSVKASNDEKNSQIIGNPADLILGATSQKREQGSFPTDRETNHPKVVSEEEQQREILAFYGEEEADNSYRESPELIAVKPDPEAQSKPTALNQQQQQVITATMEKQPRTDSVVVTTESKVEPEVEKEPPLAENMGKCEFCGHIGIRESFFSKSKRFCKMECAKRYSASNIKKKSKGEKLGTSKKKSRTTAQVKAVKTVAAPAPQQKTPPTQEVPLPIITAREVGESWQNQAFEWGEYLKKTGAKAAAAFLFKHVSLNPCLKGVHVGMKVEVVNCGIDVVDDTDVAFWVATVIHIQQYRVLLRYEGYETDPSGDFWFDLRSKNIHPVGWCARRNKLLIPPPAIREKCTNWRDYLFKCLSGAKTFSAEFLQQLQNQSYNRFQKGMKVEVADRKNMYSMCVATIVDVIGDRLRLRYDGLDPDVAEDFWCHYQSAEIHPIGWSSLVGHTLQPPIGWKHSLSKWNEFLADDLANSVDAPQEFFVQDSTGTAPGEHQFKVGMKFEAIDPFNPSHVCVVTVIKALRFNYFVLGVDSLATYFVCHANSRSIFPCGWSKMNGISISPPRDFSIETFNWPEYLAKTGGIEAPPELFRQDSRANGYRVGMKLEAVDLREPALVCPGTVTDLRGPLLRIHFDGWDDTYDQLVDMDSLDIFPVSWCCSVGHPLQPPGPMPDKYVERYGPSLELTRQPVARPPPASRAVKPAKRKSPTMEDKSQKKKAKVLYANETVYYNKKCYSGPYLSRDLMRDLPDTIKGCVSGPEKHNIMRQCLQHFVSVAHNPKQVLELFSREFYQNKKNKELHLGGTVCIETKSKNGKRLMRRVRVANKPDHLHAYLERVCQVLNCCPEVVNFTRYPLGYCSQTCLSRAKDNGVTSTSDGRTHEFVQPIVSEQSLLPNMSPSTSLPMRGEMRTPPGRSFSDSPHDSMVSSTSNLAASPAQQHQDSEAASVLLYQSSHTGKDPRQWNVQEVSNFMVSIGCSNYAEAFTKEEIDGKALLLLTQEMLESLTENKLGPMTKIQNAVRALKQAWGI